MIVWAIYAAAVLLFLLPIPISWVYWVCYIRHTHERVIPGNVIVPEDLKGSWKYGLFDGTSCGTCLCFVFCAWCSIGDLWYRSGHVHATLNRPTSAPHDGCCPGWEFFVGCCGCCMLAEMADCVAPCVLASLTGGLGFLNPDVPSNQMGSVVPFRTRFGLHHNGWGTFCNDCCAWCFCFPCQGAREYRQVQDLLSRWPLQTQQAMPMMVVGQPIMVTPPTDAWQKQP
eukprot:CAMPEP_0181507656 /NCGR_PEP_ID=MMETSP1110-20121109/59276_1 /TAXON_ID=174948 /ORGANISM="Symbiodinium sp., Strain CCMP421" /LENGTH=226 /DNA_ID=CAMNT_0023636859 /DNA_START=177 /DNA_END=857 /DNA_ORIENTATION=-